MKNVIILLFIVLLPINLSANFLNMDITASYSRNISENSNGYMISPGVYYSLVDIEVLDFSLGVEAMHYSYKDELEGQTQSLSFVPRARLEVPFFIFKAGLGYDWNKDYKSATVSSYSAAFTYTLGLVDLGLDVTLIYRMNNNSTKIFNIGPILSFGI